MSPGQSVQSLSCVQLFANPWTSACQASLSITNSWSLLKLMSIESVMPSNQLILCHPLLLLPSIFPRSGSFPMSQFFHQVAEVLEFQLQHQSFLNEYSGLISFRINWFDLEVYSQESSPIVFSTVQKHQSFSAQLSLLSNSHIHT